MSMNLVSARACILLNSVFLLASPAVAYALGSPPTYFSWQPSGANAFTADAGHFHGTLLASPGANDVVEPVTLSASAPSFISQYGAVFPVLAMSNGGNGQPANSLAQFSFNKQLPTGARLFLYDVDIALYDERVELSHVGGALTLLEQRESNAGASSVFPIWSPATGLLAAQGSQNDNNFEANIFDISGATEISARFRRSRGGNGIAGARIAIAVPVPEPPTASALAGALLTSLMRRSNRSCDR